ncbi:MAG: response regulator [Deltaproteobacteria bacterium]|nr:response regulator [Deltaproteobacteria bacterium]
MRALVVDDEQLARKYLAEMLRAHPEIRVVGECKNGFEAVKAIADDPPDLVFLDIQMPKLDGFEVLELIDEGPAVVFVTAYDQYALQAFDAHAVDYLLKPFTAERLAAAVDKVRRNLGRARPPADELRRSARPDEGPLARIVVRDGSSVSIIPVSELDYVQAEDDYIALHTGGRSLLKHQTISSLAAGLDPERFVRIHRSTVVNVERIEKIELFAKDRYIACLRDGTRLSISRSGHKRLKEVLG